MAKKIKVKEEEEEKKPEKYRNEKIVDLFELIHDNKWDILASTNELEILKEDKFNNINLKVPFILFPGSRNDQHVYVDSDDEKMEFSSVKEVLDFISDYYLTNATLLHSLFEKDPLMLTAFLVSRNKLGEYPAYTKSDWVGIFTNGFKTKFGGVYFTSAGGMVIKLLV